jgi:AcrR family transcriptional regulator
MRRDRVKLSEEALAAALGGRWSRAELSAAADGQFPSGTRSLPAELIGAVQRERLLAAMLRACAQIGYRELTVQDVLDRAGVSRPTFYEHFENKEDCFLAACTVAGTRLGDRVEAAAGDAGEPWRDRMRKGLEELLSFVRNEPDAARTLFVETRASCPEALVRRDAVLDRFAACLDGQVRAEVDTAETVSPIAAAGIVGGVEALLYDRINRRETDDLESLLPSLMYFAVLPFEGHRMASAELGGAAA